MIKTLIPQITFLIISINCISQPYNGTIFVDSDIITSSDSSAFLNATYTGQGIKTIFDRRVNNWVTVNTFLFEVAWNDGLNSEAVINSEFGTVEKAEIEAKKYGWLIGQLPHCLRLDVNEIWINKGVQPFGGGNNSILIHTGQTVLYENDKILEETLVHEASHTSLDAKHSSSSGWLEAQNLDKGFISNYAKDYPTREDIAESFLLWMAVRYREDKISTQDFKLITDAIPNRLNYFDDISCDLFPFQIENITSIKELDKRENTILAYPNPFTSAITIEVGGASSPTDISIFTIQGQLIRTLKSTEMSRLSVDLSFLESGVYVVKVIGKDFTESRRIVKSF